MFFALRIVDFSCSVLSDQGMLPYYSRITLARFPDRSGHALPCPGNAPGCSGSKKRSGIGPKMEWENLQVSAEMLYIMLIFMLFNGHATSCTPVENERRKEKEKSPPTPPSLRRTRRRSSPPLRRPITPPLPQRRRSWTLTLTLTLAPSLQIQRRPRPHPPCIARLVNIYHRPRYGDVLRAAGATGDGDRVSICADGGGVGGVLGDEEFACEAAAGLGEGLSLLALDYRIVCYGYTGCGV